VGLEDKFIDNPTEQSFYKKRLLSKLKPANLRTLSDQVMVLSIIELQSYKLL
jgi:tRNA-binding EMAP/Myf-like protein